jgi:DNA repair exonuclease SbcCD ATPase subunit
MKHQKHTQDQELKRSIDDQEQAMSQLLLRVMERPLMPLHKTVETLGAKIAAVQKASTDAMRSVEAGLGDMLEAQGVRIGRKVDDVMDLVEDGTKKLAALAKHVDECKVEQDGRNQRLQDVLAQADEAVAQQHMEVDARLTEVTAAIAQLETGLAALREQEHTGTTRLTGGLSNLAKQLDRQQGAVCERIDALQPALAAHADMLASGIDKSSKDIVSHCDVLSASTKALVAATVREQLAQQLAPLRAKNTVLLVVSAFSCAALLALLGLQYYH